MALCTRCLQICGKSLLLSRRREQHGRISHLWRAMNGYAGLKMLRSMRQGITGSRGHAQSLWKGCAGLVAGPVVLIVEARKENNKMAKYTEIYTEGRREIWRIE